MLIAYKTMLNYRESLLYANNYSFLSFLFRARRTSPLGCIRC